MKAGFSGLQGLRVFVVEDEFMVLVMIEEMLSDLGCEVVGSASRLAEALTLIPQLAIDAAVLDINLGSVEVYPIAEILAARNVPIVFSTGYGQSGVNEAWRSRPILQKPFHPQQLAAALEQATAKARVS